MRNKIRKNLTISPGNEWQYWNSRHRYAKVIGGILQQLHKMQHATFELYPEITVPTTEGTGGRIHLHGWIEISDWIAFLVDDWHLIMEIGKYSKLKEPTDKIVSSKYSSWDEYVFKERTIMEEYCKSIRVPYKLNSTTPYKNSKKGVAAILEYKNETILDKLIIRTQ